MSPPSRTFPPVSESCPRISSRCHPDCHEVNDRTHEDTINIDIGQYELDKIDAAASSSPSVVGMSSSSTSGAPSKPPTSTIRYARCVTKPSPYKHSFPHRRLFRSFPRVPHAFAQPSSNRYTPYIPISVTARKKVFLSDRNSIPEEVLGEIDEVHHQQHPLTGCSIIIPGCTKPTRSLLSDLSTDVSSEGCDTDAASPTTTGTSLDDQQDHDSAKGDASGM